MLESTLWKKVRDGLKPWRKNELSLVRVENNALPGTPDVNYAFSPDKHGWIELKSIEAFPKRKSTIVKIDHFTPQQRIFLRSRCLVENCWVLMSVGSDDYFLFSGKSASALLGKYWIKEDFEQHAVGHWKGNINFEELYNLL